MRQGESGRRNPSSRVRCPRPFTAVALALAVVLVSALSACRPAPAPQKKPAAGTASSASAALKQSLTFGASTETSDTIIYLGDTQADESTGQVVFGSLLAKATARDLIVLGGDLVNDPQDPAEWKAFARQFPAPVDPDRQVAVVPGNHTPDPPALALFAKQAPATIRMAQTEVVLLDSNLLGSLDDDQIARNQAAFKQALAQQGNRALILVMHHPLFVLDGNPKDVTRAQTMMKNYGQFFKQADLILCGHEHMYARYTDPDTGIIQVMGNASGKGYEPSNPQMPGLEKLYTATPVTTRITISSQTLTLQTNSAQGAPLDAATITR